MLCKKSRLKLPPKSFTILKRQDQISAKSSIIRYFSTKPLPPVWNKTNFESNAWYLCFQWLWGWWSKLRSPTFSSRATSSSSSSSSYWTGRRHLRKWVLFYLSTVASLERKRERGGGSEWVVAFSQTLFSFASSQSIVIISRFIMASQSRQSLHWGRQGHLGLLLHYYGNQSSIHLTTWKKMNLIDDNDNTFQHYHWRNKHA